VKSIDAKRRISGGRISFDMILKGAKSYIDVGNSPSQMIFFTQNQKNPYLKIVQHFPVTYDIFQKIKHAIIQILYIYYLVIW
jgi:hypothetical protein